MFDVDPLQIISKIYLCRFLKIAMVIWILLSYFKLTTASIKIFCQLQFLLIPYTKLADKNQNIHTVYNFY